MGVLANFSMLCTMQYGFHCVLTLARPRWLKRVKRLLCLMLANTGSTVPKRWLYSCRPLGESMAYRKRSLGWVLSSVLGSKRVPWL